MTPRGWVWLLAREVSAQRARLLILALCVALTGLVFGLAFSAVLYLRGEIRPRLRELFPERRVVVTPASSDVFFLKLEGPRITPGAVDQFRAMPEVARAYPQLSASFPVSADFEMQSLGVGFVTDIILFGVDFDLLRDTISPEAWAVHERQNDGAVPVLISEYFLDAYNLGLAESSGMPKLSRSSVLGVEFDLLMGESTIGMGAVSAAPKARRARVVGMTPDPLLFGVTMPIEPLREANQRYTPRKQEAYAALHIDLASPEGQEAVREKAGELKLGFSAQADILERYLRVVGSIEGLLLAGLLMVVALGGVGVFATTAAALRDFRPRWGLYRAAGLGPGGVLVLAQGYVLAAAVPGAVLAGLGCAAVARGLSMTVGETISNLSIFPGDPFALGWEAYSAVLIFSLFFAGIPAGIFSFISLRKKPVELLSERSL